MVLIWYSPTPLTRGGPGRGSQNDGSVVPPEVPAIAAMRAEHPKNLMAKHFDEDYFFSQPRQRRARLLRCCEGGLLNPAGPVGLYASNLEDYHDFKPYFDKVRGEPLGGPSGSTQRESAKSSSEGRPRTWP